MKQIHLHGKAFTECDFRGLVIGGQNDADTIRFVIPKTYAGEVDLSDSVWSFYITYENKEGQGDTVLLTKSLSNQSETIYLDWKPGQTATQVEGKLTCQVFGTKAGSGDAVCRFTTLPFAVYISKWLNPDPITQSLPTVIEQALELMAEYNAQLEDAFEAKDTAVESAKIAERYAKGTEGGVAVESGTGYHDNSKYYSELAKNSQTAAKASEDAALASKNAAATSQSAAKTSETNAKASETAAKNSQTAAKASEDAALASKNAAATSQSAAKTSETNAKASETAAKNSQTAAKASEDAALVSKNAAAASQSAAKTSETNAKASETAAKSSQTAAKSSEDAALASKNAAAASQTAAKASEDAAKASEEAAAESADDAAASASTASSKASDAASSASTATSKAAEATTKASEAATSASQAASSASTAGSKATAAASSASDAEAQRKLAERYAVGTEDGTPVSSGEGYENNAKYWADQAKATINVSGAASSIISENLTPSRAVVSDGAGKVAVSPVTSTELGYLDGVTSSVQNQLNGKQATITGGASTITSANLTASRALVSDGSGKVVVSPVTSTELGYLDGVTSAIQTQINGKQATITGGASTITSANLTASRALVSDGSGKVAVSAVTLTELGYLDGVTSAVQTQLNNKLGKTEKAASATSADSAAKLTTARTISLTGPVTGSVSFNGSANVSIATSLPNAERRLPAGSLIWFAGKRAQKPKYTLVCDGAAVSRTTYADLFAAIGTIYGAGDGSTTFNLPNLMDAGDDGTLGYFIRAAVDDASIGTKQEDAIRNITGRIQTPDGSRVYKGAFYSISGSIKGASDTGLDLAVGFDANRDNSGYGNPCSGHATGPDIHPYAISLTPLIAI